MSSRRKAPDGVRRGNWSSQELARLKVLYPQGGEHHASRLLRRSVVSIRKRVRALFEQPKRKGPFSRDEDSQLRLSYGVLGIRALCIVLGRSRVDVVERIKHLRDKRRRGPWTRSEEILLKRIYSNRTDEDLEVCLSRSRAQIVKTAARLCLAKDKRFSANKGRSTRRKKTPMPRWSPEDEQRLEELYPDLDNLEIAKILGRTVASVANKGSQMGLRKSATSLARMGKDNVALRYRGEA